MADRYEVLSPRVGNDGKTYFTRMGIAFPMKDRDGYRVMLEAVPLPSLKDGKLECVLLLMPPKDGQRPAGKSRDDDFDQPIPF